MKKSISISYDSSETKITAILFAKKHHFPCEPLLKSNADFILHYGKKYIELREQKKDIAIYIDFISGNLAHRQQYGGGRGQNIAKAIGLKQGSKPPYVIDATAGLAKDAFILACLGCRVTLIERSPIITELIQDAIKRATASEKFDAIMSNGFNLVTANSIEYIKNIIDSPDTVMPEVIYLDPMFPERKKSASVKKNMQILQSLLTKDDDTLELLDVCLKAAKKRVVVKRPKGSSHISPLQPSYQVHGKTTRYDIYLITGNDNELAGKNI